MDAERWEKLERLFHQALECEPRERSRMLGEACSGDEDLRREVESLLAEHERGGSLLKTPASDLAADWAQSHHQIKAEEMLGHFRILAPLGRGGMGEVYLAEDTRLGRKVALKVPRFQALLDNDLRRRFLREAEAAARLNHPNLVALYEVGEENSICYLASEYCPGLTLAQWLRAQPTRVAPVEAATIVLALAGGVEHAHSRGVLHRDIKPANCFISADGAMKVGDFGLSISTIARGESLITAPDCRAKIRELRGDPTAAEG